MVFGQTFLVDYIIYREATRNAKYFTLHVIIDKMKRLRLNSFIKQKQKIINFGWISNQCALPCLFFVSVFGIR